VSGVQRLLLAALLLWAWPLAVASAGPGETPPWPPWDYAQPTAGPAVRAAGATPRPSGTLQILGLAAIRGYQVVLSKPYNMAFNPAGCPFSPTCSAYGHAAIRRYGLWRGLLMTSDRLQRCRPGAHLAGYSIDERDGHAHLSDPPRWLQPAVPSGGSAR